MNNDILFNTLNIYEDRNHVKYIAFKESQFNPDELQWYYDAQNSLSLDELVKQFPYVPLIYDEKTGGVIESKKSNYNGGLTNNFHILYAKYLDHKYENNKEYEIDVSSIYNMDKKESPATITLNEKNIIQDPNEGIVIDNDKIPEKIELKGLPKNYHPNRDINGNYLAGPMQNYVNNFIYNPGSVYVPNAYPQYISQYRTYGNVDPTDINRHIIRFG